MIIALPYVSFVIILFSLYLFGKSGSLYKSVSVITSYFLLVVFFGLRGYIFSDVFAYKPFYDIIPDFITIIKTGYPERGAWWEPGFVLYCSIIKIFTDDYLVFQFIDTTINLVLLYKALKWFDSHNGLIFMILLSMSGLTLFIDTLRNTKAILIFFVSLRYIYNKSFIKYIICCFLALSFHISSIVLFPLYFFLNKKYSKLFLAFILLMSIFLFLFGRKIVSTLLPIILSSIPGMPDMLLNRIEGYMVNESEYSAQRGLSLGLIETFLTFLFMSYFYNKICNNKITMIVNSFVLYFFFYFAFSGFYEVSHRMSMLFVFSYWILWYQFLVCIRPKQIKNVFLCCFLIYSVLKCSQYSKPMQEYDNILIGGHQRFHQRYYRL